MVTIKPELIGLSRVYHPTYGEGVILSRHGNMASVAFRMKTTVDTWATNQFPVPVSELQDRPVYDKPADLSAAKDRIIIGLDPLIDSGTAFAQLRKLVEVGFFRFKVHPTWLLKNEGLGKTLCDLGDRVKLMYDAKLWDTKETVRRTIYQVGDLGFDSITVSHSSLRDAAEATANVQRRPKIIAVRRLSTEKPATDSAWKVWIRDTAGAGLADGLVVPGGALRRMGDFTHPGAPIYGVGIRPTGVAKHDHAEVATPVEVSSRAAFLIVGRPIWSGPEQPVEAATKIAQAIA